MVNEAFRESLKELVTNTEQALQELEDLVELGKQTENRNLEAEAQVEATKAKLVLWKKALEME